MAAGRKSSFLERSWNKTLNEILVAENRTSKLVMERSAKIKKPNCGMEWSKKLSSIQKFKSYEKK
jgi:hypothetical protein